MSAIAFGTPVQSRCIEGITKLSGVDIRYAEQLGYRIKLLGITKRRDDKNGIELRVHPTLVPAKRLIANVEGAISAVVVQGDAVGTTLSPQGCRFGTDGQRLGRRPGNTAHP